MAGETAVAAMGFVAHCDALIFDLRRITAATRAWSNSSPVTCSILNPGISTPSTTVPATTPSSSGPFPTCRASAARSAGLRVDQQRHRFGAEEFAYNLKQMERATPRRRNAPLGAAHPVTVEDVQEHSRSGSPTGGPSTPSPRGTGKALASNRTSPSPRKRRFRQRISTPSNYCWRGTRVAIRSVILNGRSKLSAVCMRGWRWRVKPWPAMQASMAPEPLR